MAAAIGETAVGDTAGRTASVGIIVHIIPVLVLTWRRAAMAERAPHRVRHLL